MLESNTIHLFIKKLQYDEFEQASRFYGIMSKKEDSRELRQKGTRRLLQFDTNILRGTF